MLKTYGTLHEGLSDQERRPAYDDTTGATSCEAEKDVCKCVNGYLGCGQMISYYGTYLTSAATDM